MDVLLTPSLMLFIYCAAVFLIALMGGWFILALRLNHTRLQIALSAVAGLMLGIGLMNFIPHAIHQNNSPTGTMRWVLCGFLLMFFLQRIFFYHHHHSLESDFSPKLQTSGISKDDQPQHTSTIPHSHAAHQKGISWLGTAVGLSLHSLVDGIVLATAATFTIHPTQSIWTGLGVALAIILHKPFGAAAISTLMISRVLPLNATGGQSALRTRNPSCSSVFLYGNRLNSPDESGLPRQCSGFLCRHFSMYRLCRSAPGIAIPYA